MLSGSPRYGSWTAALRKMHQPSMLIFTPRIAASHRPGRAGSPAPQPVQRDRRLVDPVEEPDPDAELARGPQGGQVVGLLGQPDHLVDRRDPDRVQLPVRGAQGGPALEPAGPARPCPERCPAAAWRARAGCPSARRPHRARSGHRAGPRCSVMPAAASAPSWRRPRACRSPAGGPGGRRCGVKLVTGNRPSASRLVEGVALDQAPGGEVRPPARRHAPQRRGRRTGGSDSKSKTGGARWRPDGSACGCR